MFTSYMTRIYLYTPSCSLTYVCVSPFSVRSLILVFLRAPFWYVHINDIRIMYMCAERACHVSACIYKYYISPSESLLYACIHICFGHMKAESNSFRDYTTKTANTFERVDPKRTQSKHKGKCQIAVYVYIHLHVYICPCI